MVSISALTTTTESSGTMFTRVADVISHWIEEEVEYLADVKDVIVHAFDDIDQEEFSPRGANFDMSFEENSELDA
ncbi:hypothetical protein SARC_01304 [Sphaeroforma arctica JP610]|uniref:Uncharacterized protein n=1 Tax=Sphaeroforma arctica JP610 TaxID=667725 RepID=A0A0L0GCA1_9EUKA|nr:hypothetical protein SARC_01304 [Sphaeroforma arctica JP610]KNC86531.1 hypothetical protein SARC_01304 [Sphaeroforma arctica JP610]|eukprot:XP_014160433.1 hypothetical protein SARC_01304 [Sphaeroforma arctica JP610]